MKNRMHNILILFGVFVMSILCLSCFDLDPIEDIITQDPDDETTPDPVVETTPDPEVETLPEPESLPLGEGLAIGATAPDFSLPDGDGNIHSLSDYANKKVALVFFSTLS